MNITTYFYAALFDRMEKEGKETKCLKRTKKRNCPELKIHRILSQHNIFSIYSLQQKKKIFNHI